MHPAWLLQDRLVAQIHAAAYRPWPFNEWSEAGRPRRAFGQPGKESSHLSPAQLLVSLSAFVEGHSAEELARQIGVQPRIGQRMRRLY